MAHALMVSEQHVDPGVFTCSSSLLALRDEPSQEPPYTLTSTMLEIDFQRRVLSPAWFSRRQTGIRSTTHRSSPADARYALEQIKTSRKAAILQRQMEEETAWIAANRARFAGRWVALVGGTLLAIGDSAQEVHMASSQTVPTPLIIRLDDITLPFAGW